MAKVSLAVKYRPKTWDDLTEQESIKLILTQQLESGEVKNAYLFCGGAGTGKTTSARIFANEINRGLGNPIELDAASNNSVNDMRNLIQQSKTQSLDSEYKVFIIDECHSLSDSAWQAMLKVLEEPPMKSIFIFCTTNPEKIPRTILSRVQRYDFQRISQDGIVERLGHILNEEHIPSSNKEGDAIEYIAKIADGGMRDAITLLDKCLAYSTELTVENIVKALGTVDYDIMFKLSDAIIFKNKTEIINVIEQIHTSGKDLKQFMRDYCDFVLDICKYGLTGRSFELIRIPQTYEKTLRDYSNDELGLFWGILDTTVDLNARIKWDNNPKSTIEASLLLGVQK